MNQHFVPVVYLKNFSYNGKQINVYDKVIQKYFTTSISSVASKESFYDDSNKNSVESINCKIETETGVVLKKLINDLTNKQFSKIAANQKDVLIKFIWLQMNRTIEARIDFGSMDTHLYNKLANTSHPIDAIRLLSDAETVDKHIEFISNSFENKFALNTLAERNFILVKNETKYELITSDDPVIRHVHWDIDPRVYEIFLPINPHYAIWIMPKNIYAELDRADGLLYLFDVEDNILFYNHLQIYHSTRQLFSLNEKFDYVHEIVKSNPALGDISRKRLD